MGKIEGKRTTYEYQSIIQPTTVAFISCSTAQQSPMKYIYKEFLLATHQQHRPRSSRRETTKCGNANLIKMENILIDSLADVNQIETLFTRQGFCFDFAYSLSTETFACGGTKYENEGM